jgi:hypothetical protein
MTAEVVIQLPGSCLYTVIWRQNSSSSYPDNVYTVICHTAIENLSDPIGYLLDFTNPYYTALAGNMKARAKKDNSFWNRT